MLFQRAAPIAKRITQVRGLRTSAPRLSDDHHAHKVFYPPYNKAPIAAILSFCIFGCGGLTAYAAIYQQQKAGKWFTGKK